MIKIAVPWPYKPESQPRIAESLSLWEDKKRLLLCLVEDDDSCSKDFDIVVLPRNSLDIGTKTPKCYIYDMVKAARDRNPEADWVGFGNSDCVPVGDMVDGHDDREVLIYHRTDIPQWENRFRVLTEKPVPPEIVQQIWKWRQSGETDKRICKRLNRIGVKPPQDAAEWNYVLLKRLFLDQGVVFFWGQDMYLFRADVVDRVLEEYLKPKDPILGTGGFDPRLSKWLVDNFNAARMINKIYHRAHQSEWNVDEAEYFHNGGDIKSSDRINYFEDTFLMSLCEHGQRGAIPKYIKYLVGKDNSELYDVIVVK